MEQLTFKFHDPNYELEDYGIEEYKLVQDDHHITFKGYCYKEGIKQRVICIDVFEIEPHQWITLKWNNILKQWISRDLIKNYVEIHRVKFVSSENHQKFRGVVKVYENAIAAINAGIRS